MSGNGGHLLIQICEQPNNEDTRKKKERLVRFLSQKFSNANAIVDSTVYNMSRPCKLYGTMAVKGDNVPDRPHRRSSLSNFPECLPKPVNLYSLMSHVLPPEEEKKTSHTPPLLFDFSDAELIEKAKNAKNGTKFTALWEGDLSEYGNNHSDADCALCCLLAFWTGGDRGRIDRLFRQSGLCREEKWVKREDYRDLTINKALEKITEFYNPNGQGRESTTSGGEPGANKGKNPKGRDETPPKDSDGKKPSASDVAKSWLNNCGFQQGELCLRYYREVWWMWDGEKYENLPAYELRAVIAQFIDDKTAVDVTKNFVSNVIETLTGLCLISSKVEMPAWLGESNVKAMGRTVIFENGWLDLDELIAGEETELQAHTPKLFSMNALPYQFDEESNCPKWLEFLNCNIEGDIDRINVLKDFSGYCLLSNNLKFHKFLLLEGEAGTGKSTFCTVLRALLGEKNVSHVPLELFGERFALYSTLDKLANIVEEVGELDTVAEGQLKAFTSGSPMQFERKYKEPIMAIPTAKLILATNNRPRLKDRSGGVWRRMILVPWQKVIPETEWDRELDMKIINDELPGVFLWALAGLARLLESNGFSSSETVKTATEEYKLEENPTRIFLLDNYEEAEGYVEVKEIYSEYVTWCKDFGYESLNNLSFGKEVRRAFPKVANRMRKGDTDKRCRTYFGIIPKT